MTTQIVTVSKLAKSGKVGANVDDLLKYSGDLFFLKYDEKYRFKLKRLRSRFYQVF